MINLLLQIWIKNNNQCCDTDIIKYGNNINLMGSNEFKTKFINRCVKQKINTITFIDDNLNNKYHDFINNKKRFL